MIKFSGVPLGEACTVVLRGATQQILDEAERSLHDALCVLTSTIKETRTVFGGGRWRTMWWLFCGVMMVSVHLFQSAVAKLCSAGGCLSACYRQRRQIHFQFRSRM